MLFLQSMTQKGNGIFAQKKCRTHCWALPQKMPFKNEK